MLLVKDYGNPAELKPPDKWIGELVPSKAIKEENVSGNALARKAKLHLGQG